MERKSKEGPPPIQAGIALAPELCVIEHLHRSKHTDVYRVVDERDGCERLAKVVRPDLRHKARAVARVRDEATRLAQLHHPSVGRCVRPIDEPPGSVLEIIPGPTLHKHLRGGRALPPEEVARLAAELASALVAVHAAGLIHCDVKPANVLVGPERFVLIDFDLARPPGPARAGLGTRLFAAPEQATGGLLGPAVDAWGLGVVLFRATTGRLPFSGDGYPQLQQRAPQIDPMIDALLAPSPSARPSLETIATAR